MPFFCADSSDGLGVWRRTRGYAIEPQALTRGSMRRTKPRVRRMRSQTVVEKRVSALHAMWEEREKKENVLKSPSLAFPFDMMARTMKTTIRATMKIPGLIRVRDLEWGRTLWTDKSAIIQLRASKRQETDSES